MKRKYVLLLSSFIVALIIGSVVYDAMVRGSGIAHQFLFDSAWKIGVLIAIVVLAHFLEPKAHLSTASLATLPGLLGILGFIEIENVGRHDAQVVNASLLLLMYAASLFVILSDILLAGGAAYLTKARGEKWTKELDYVYFGLGGVGAFVTLNRLDLLSGPILNNEQIGLAILASSIVVRLIKTRADIGDWNKLQTNNGLVPAVPAFSEPQPPADFGEDLDPKAHSGPEEVQDIPGLPQEVVGPKGGAGEAVATNVDGKPGIAAIR